MYNYNGGQAIFYIPPTPFAGEIENYNFLIAKDLWDWHAQNGKISWETSKLTVINANKSLCHNSDKVDEFLRNECQKRNIDVLDNTTMMSVNKVFI